MAETEIRKYFMKLKEMEDRMSSWKAQWKDIADFMMPRKSRYLMSSSEESNPGAKKHQFIINGSSKDALRTLASGMQAGLTSPSRAWFSLGVNDDNLNELPNVKLWTHEVRNRMLTVFAKSNFYGSAYNVYKELGAFGTSAMLIEEDYKTAVRFRQMTIGEYSLALDYTNRVDTLYRRFTLTARQMVEKFGIDNVSDLVKGAIRNNKGEQRFEVRHAIQPNNMFDPSSPLSTKMPYESAYFEANTTAEKFLRKGGYKSKPMVTPRWDVTAGDEYGESPGMDALGDVKMLQKIEEKKLRGLDKMIDPPMVAPTSAKGETLTLVAGGVTYLDTVQGQQAYAPVQQVQLDFQNIAFEIDRVERRIRRFFFNDLFLSLINEEKTMTATEVAERHSEKMMMLGPIIERLQSEFLDIIIERTFSIMVDLGLIPPAPEEIQGAELKINYIGILVQAQKISGIESVRSTMGFAVELAQIKPDIMDKIDVDEAIDQFSDMAGTPPTMIRSDEDVAKIRAQRAEQQQMAARQEQINQLSDDANKLGNTPMGTGSALDKLVDSTKGQGTQSLLPQRAA